MGELKERLKGLMHLESDDDVETLMNVQATWTKDADDSLAADATAERPFFRAEHACRVKAVYYIPNAAVTGHASNGATILVDKRPASDYTTPTNLAEGATLTGDEGSMVAFTPWPLNLSTVAGVIDLAAGDVLTVEVTKAASGVVLELGELVVDLEYTY